MILESIVTTVDAAGVVNIAPMGPYVDDKESPFWQRFILRPFTSSQTFQNLNACRTAVVHVTDDAMLFAQTAVDTISHQEAVQRYVRRLDTPPCWILNNCCRWFAVEAETVVVSQPRAEMVCKVIATETVRPFFGFNRAKHAVIEAAILATRTHLIAAESLQEQMERLRPLIEKTGGEAEHDAFELLERSMNERLQRS